MQSLMGESSWILLDFSHRNSPQPASGRAIRPSMADLNPESNHFSGRIACTIAARSQRDWEGSQRDWEGGVVTTNQTNFTNQGGSVPESDLIRWDSSDSWFSVSLSLVEEGRATLGINRVAGTP